MPNTFLGENKMTENELAKRAIACKHWRWMPGMLALDTDLRLDEMTSDWEAEAPDLTDPATLGCLLVLVREAWGVGSLVYRPWNGAIRAWRVVTFAHDEEWMSVARILGEGATEAEALVAALEAAP